MCSLLCLVELLEFVVQLVVTLLDDFSLEVEFIVRLPVLESSWDEAREDVMRLSDHVVEESVVFVHLVESLIRDHSNPLEVKITLHMRRLSNVEFQDD